MWGPHVGVVFNLGPLLTGLGWGGGRDTTALVGPSSLAREGDTHWEFAAAHP
jgi:hypothetical protein